MRATGTGGGRQRITEQLLAWLALSDEAPSSWRAPLAVGGGLVVVLVLGVLDRLTGSDFAFALFYVFPVIVGTLAAGRTPGMLLSLAGAASWYWANASAAADYSHPAILYWNTLSRLAFFIIIALLLAELRNLLAFERRLSRTDFLTGATNGRAFYEIAEREMERTGRYGHPFTLVYFDLDNFKLVNDRYGHQIGDLLLQEVVRMVTLQLRATDVVARLGGDEFALLLPETGRAGAELVVNRLRESLAETMEARGWPVTLSIGVLTCPLGPPSVDALIQEADALMYRVKQMGKDAVDYAEFRGPTTVVGAGG